PVITAMADQQTVVAGKVEIGATMRLGEYPAKLVPDSIVAEVYGTTDVSERHRHRYEVNGSYREVLEKVGLHVSGTSPDGQLIEFVELDRSQHPFFVATQSHPELKSRPTQPHPLFTALIKAALERKQPTREPVAKT
ncbi:MAG: gamma-glutamyl-gamma-aminobutyrate hydrolase family protein, partial [Propionibacteriaceae bacterium]|nr:gamma-glutamyl-gamma-aminobutyrate hydrolase family protein [Propionibacteriaceae bacterium]